MSVYGSYLHRIPCQRSSGSKLGSCSEDNPQLQSALQIHTAADALRNDV